MEDIIGAAIPAMREIKPVQPNDLALAEHRHLAFAYVLRPGQQLSDLLVPDSFSLAAAKLHRLDQIEVTSIDGSLWALLLVTAVGPEFAQLHVLLEVNLPTAPLSEDDLPINHRAFFLGSKRLWCIMRGDQILKHSFTTKSEAIAWCIETFRS